MTKQWTFKPNKSVKIRSKKGAIRGLALAGEHLLGESNKQVPIEEATLERSGAASVDEAKLRGAVSYDTPYAVKQHEDLNLKHDSGRNAKYLENAFNSEADTVAKIIADAIKGEL
jgi:hypothetical protein